ncbi:right-handed parallel beta-helix repeat-containing protein [Pontiella desulfatans]|nr:right-handed parallel beta-helix repeat-containing protein [Pontiella desulfatans]
MNSPVQNPPYTNGWNEAAHTLQQVLPYAQDGDVIFVMPGTYSLASSIVITNNLEIRSFLQPEPEHVVFDGQGLHTCFNLGNTDTRLHAFTIRNAKTAGIRCSGSQPAVYSCIVEDTDGTGMVNGRASDCIFRNNTGAYYGGGANKTVATGCSFVDNEAYQGGGGYQVAATDCTFQNNTSSGEGGGLYYGTATNCLFVGNVAAGSGGGLCSSTAIGCAISGNRAGGYGGGLYLSTATHCTITENTASVGGGMAYGQAYNSILWNNTATDNSATTYNTTIQSCCLPDYTANGSITNNPQLLSISHLAATSPCLGAGNAAYAVGTDIDGEEWLAAPAIGCDEIIPGAVEGAIICRNDLPERIAEGQPIFFTAYVEGAVTRTVLDFGDGSAAVTNATTLTHSHAWTYGNYHVVLTGYNDSYPGGISTTNTVFVRRDLTTTIYVSDADGNDSNDGESWATAKKTIQAGVDVQDYAGGLVLVSNGTYSVTAEIIVEKDIRIQSVNGATLTTIQGDTQHQCLYLNNRNCLVEGFTIKKAGGYSVHGTSGGGAIYCSGINPVVSNCIITENNSGGYGGGVMWRGTANNCTFSKNTASNGPGGMQSGSANDCLFLDNTTVNNGAGGMQGGIANRCIFKENEGPIGGGARDTIANDCQFIQNLSTTLGGGMYNGTANNCVFNQNKAYQGGGGTYGTKATHCTITANQAGTSGGGMYGGTADHCIIWHNTALESANDLFSTTANTSCSAELTHGSNGNITNNPQLVSASHIALTSPCAGSGTIPRDTLDIDGEHWRSIPAMGCDEPADAPIGDLTITIDGPSDLPAGFKTFFTVDIQGALSGDTIDFGDGETAIRTGIIPIWHTWNAPGTYDMVITAYNADHPAGYSVTKTITVFAADFSTIYVSPNGSDENNGHSWGTAKKTIQAAIDEQEFPGGRVLLADGTYTLAATIKIDKDIQLLSQNGAATTIIDAGSLPDYQHSRAMEIGDNHSIITGLTIRNADFTWTGGAVFCDYTRSPILSNCILSDNHAGTAGGMCYGTAIDCVFSNNTASTGAGLYLSHATRCEFIANTASGSGGGMYGGTADDCTFIKNRIYTTGSNYGNGAGMSKGIANNCTFTRNDSNGYGGGINEGTANDCLFIENTAVHGGGGIRDSVANRCSFIENSAASSGGAIHNGTATRCVISGNRATLGGGMYAGFAYNCAISGNIADDIGGGTHSTKLFNCTVTGNSASDAGGVYGQTKNCIVWGNTATTGNNDINDGNINLNYIVNTCSPDAPHGTDGSITNNPLLVSGSHIAVNSPCIGAGNAAYATGTDLDGETWNTPPAMGCDEIGASLSGPIEMAFYGPSPIAIYIEGNYVAQFNGQVSKTIVDFGDGTRITNTTGVLSHSWSGPNSANYDVVLTAFNDTYPSGLSRTQTVQVVSNDDSDIHVKHFGNDSNDGTSWATAKQTIQAGVDAQNIHGGRVLIDAGTYHITEPIVVNKAVHLKGDNDEIVGTLPIPVIDAGGSNRCFQLGYSACVLENLAIQNGATATGGSGDNIGGGIYCQNGAPRITYSTISNCAAYYGGGAYKGTLENCTLANNTATSQGGAAYQSMLTGSTLSGNTAGYGGALSGGTLNGCILSNNTATTQGGAAYDSTVLFSTITSNAAPSGGGLASCMADRCDISTNRASVSGGGIFNGTAHNCTFHFNFATQYGGGTYNTTLRNCTLVENGADTGGGSYSGYAYNSIIYSNFAWTAGIDLKYVTAKNSCSPDLTHGPYGNITNAPLFVAHAPDFLIRGSGYYLSILSPCINAGSNSYVESDRDFNGWARILNGTVDMGANESWISGGDYDSDGMDDDWELENFGGVTNAVADENSDSDIFNNRDEFIAGTDPLDPDSYFRIIQQEMTSNTIVLHWDSVNDRSYQVLWSDSLTNEFQAIDPVVNYPGSSCAVEKTNGAAFYKINVWTD